MTPVLETGETVVALLTIIMMGTAMMIVIAGPLFQTAEIILEAALVMTDAASLHQNQGVAPVILQNVRNRRLEGSKLCKH